MGFLSSTFAQIVLQVLFYLTVNCQAQLEPVVNVTKIKDGEPFTITCATNRVILPTQDSNVLKIFGLSINVSTSAHPMWNIAQFHPSSDSPNDQFKNVTTSGWTVNFSGGNGTGNNRQTIKIEVMVQKAVCADAGLYTCGLQYLNGPLLTPSMVQNVTAEAATTEPVLSLLPLKSEANSFSNYSMYDLGEMVTMTCRVNGPPNMALVWRREMRPSLGSEVFEDYPVQNDITTVPASPIASSGACSQFEYVSHLRFNVSEQDTKRVYQCVIQVNSADSMKVSAIIDLVPVTLPPDTVKETGPDKGGVGMIVGIVVGCVIFLLIILVVILCVVCHRRSKKRGDDTNNNMNNTADHPDSSASQPSYASVPPRISYGGNPHSRSSVPAGKINRGLDSSFESSNKPPPVYTIDNNNEAPRRPNVDMKYVNLGYDETKPSNISISRSPPPIAPKPPVAPKPQNNEIVKTRRYSTEDGTDDHEYYYGNEDFGTNV